MAIAAGVIDMSVEPVAIGGRLGFDSRGLLIRRILSCRYTASAVPMQTLPAISICIGGNMITGLAKAFCNAMCAGMIFPFSA